MSPRLWWLALTTRRTHARWLRMSACAATFIVAGGALVDAQFGPIDQGQYPLVSLTTVSPERQKELGLVTIRNPPRSCSGTLLNRTWVLTADHCVSANGEIKGPSAMLSNLSVSAAWTERTATPTQIIRLWGDVALLRLGHGDLGTVTTQLIYHAPVETTDDITKFGRGISEFARFDANGNPVPAVSDNTYRSAVFTPSSTDEESITYVPTDPGGEITAGGDSGGPDFLAAPDGTLLGIVGIMSRCGVEYLSGMPQSWMWAERVTYCISEALYPQRADILDISGRRTIASNDFNDDNLPDIVWHNSSRGETQIWFMDYSSRVGRVTVVDENADPILVALPWRIVGSRDFDRDDQTDLLWYNEATKELQIWIMERNRIRSRLPVLWDNNNQAFIGWPFTVVGVNDMDGDRYADIIWHNAVTGETQLWIMKGHRLSYRRTVHDENLKPMLVGWPWRIVATSDMNQDRRVDIVWYNDLSGETQVWYMDNWRIMKRQTVMWETVTLGAALVAWPWRITSANDFDDDRIGDIVWHNASTGETQIWFMNVGSIKRRATVDALRDGGDGQFVTDPFRIMPH